MYSRICEYIRAFKTKFHNQTGAFIVIVFLRRGTTLFNFCLLPCTMKLSKLGFSKKKNFP